MKFITFTSIAISALLCFVKADEYAHGTCGFDQFCHLRLDNGDPYYFECDPATICTCNGCGRCTLSNINNGYANCE